MLFAVVVSLLLLLTFIVGYTMNKARCDTREQWFSPFRKIAYGNVYICKLQ